MTEAEAGKLTAYLASLYDVPAWTDERLTAFAAEIQDLEYAAGVAAARRWVRLHNQRPQPSDIRQMVAETALALPGPEEAWGELSSLLQSCPVQPEFSHPALSEALRLTGRSWADLRYMQYDQYPWLKRDFQNAYREVADKLQTDGQIEPRTMIGREEARAVLDDIQKKLSTL